MGRDNTLPIPKIHYNDRTKMTIKELKAELEKYDEDLLIIVQEKHTELPILGVKVYNIGEFEKYWRKETDKDQVVVFDCAL